MPSPFFYVPQEKASAELTAREFEVDNPSISYCSLKTLKDLNCINNSWVTLVSLAGEKRSTRLVLLDRAIGDNEILVSPLLLFNLKIFDKQGNAEIILGGSIGL